MALTTIGWREWASLPELGVPQIKAKIDTGARSSCLHAFSVERYEEGGIDMVRFGLHPEQGNSDLELWANAPLVDEREITDSGGHKEMRPVIKTAISIGGETVTAEISLTNRDTMLFRMLIGRTAMNRRFVVDPSRSYLLGDRL